MNNPWQTLDTRMVYENPWIRVREDKVINPSGGEGIYGVVMYRNRAVGVVPLDAEGYTWLVGQYRYTHDSYEWEIPEGGCPEHESLESCAHRELKEETGLLAAHLEHIAELQLSNSTTDEVAHLFIARELTQADAEPEETEQLMVRRLPFDEALAMVMRSEIKDAMSVAAILKVAILTGRLPG